MLQGALLLNPSKLRRWPYPYPEMNLTGHRPDHSGGYQAVDACAAADAHQQQCLLCFVAKNSPAICGRAVVTLSIPGACVTSVFNRKPLVGFPDLGQGWSQQFQPMLAKEGGHVANPLKVVYQPVKERFGRS
jgi:hypothetical protein